MKCPNCKEDGISILRRMFLGPAIPAKCKRCGKKIYVSSSGTRKSMIPFAMGFVFAMFVDEPMYKIAIYTIGAMMAMAYNIKYAKLVGEKDMKSLNKKK